MTTTRRRAAVIAAVAAAFAVAVAPPGPVNADEEPTVTIDGTICYERVKDNQNNLVVSMSEESREDVVVTMHTEDGSAKSPKDYQGSDRMVVVIPAGKTRVLVPLVIVDDGQKEGDENFFVIVDSVEGAAMGTEKAEVTIKDGSPPRPPRR